MWDPGQYSRFSAERSRPFFDLLAQVPAAPFKHIVDLGCGPGHLTRTLAERWPEAAVVGVDNSSEMLDTAHQHSIPGHLTFVAGDITSWRANKPVDLIVSNAALQWVPDHDRLLPRLLHMLSPTGTLAVQIPSRFDGSAQHAIDQTIRMPRWRKLEGLGLHAGSVLPLARYQEQLHDLGFAVNAWETTYYHVLGGDNPVLDWLQGTALRPMVQAVGPGEAEQFLHDVGEQFRLAYPKQSDRTVFPFTRIFFVASRQGSM